MKKQFTVVVPDQPFSDTTIENKMFTLEYNGPRYLVISVINDNNNTVRCVDGSFDDISKIDLDEFINEDDTFHIIDADKHTLEAAYMTHNYKGVIVEDYKETLPTGEEYVYDYPDEGVLLHLYPFQNLIYDASTDSFSPLTYVSMDGTQEEFETTVQKSIDEANALKEQDLSDADIVKVDEYITKLQAVLTDYPNVEYWKIPYPIRPNV